ncbi:MAG: 50S ribosomal protein L1 [Simkaniaceae bacterium]|nr:50S ribosomal protein L1 [Simkaniaceae bacterium]
MTKRSKKFKKTQELVDKEKSYALGAAVEVLKKVPTAKFDESVEIALRIGVDPKKSDQQIRSTVFLPHGSGKTIRVIAFARGDKVKEALSAGADRAGDQELIDKIKGGWTDFDAIVATPDMMREVGKLGKILGPRGLMPTPKAGTVATDVKKAVEDLKKGKIAFKVDKNSVVNNLVGKLSFTKDQLVENIESLLNAILKAKPATAKGQYLCSLFLSSTMGPGLKIDINSMALS